MTAPRLLPDRVDTPRLLLRPGRAGDAATLTSLLSEWEVARWLANVPHPFHEGDAHDWIRTAEEVRHEGQVLALVVTRRADGEVVGGIELNLRRGEFGYWIGIPHQRRGYGREAAGAMLRLAFDDLGVPELGAATLPENVPSGRLLEALGFQLRGIEDFDFGLRGGVRPGRIFTLTAERWRTLDEKATS